jgi:hypothetical protein
MRPQLIEFARTLRMIAALLGEREADYCFEGRFRFRLDGEWSLVVSADDAGRFKFDACLRSRVRATMWSPAEDRTRIEALVCSARDEAAVLAA